MLRSPEIRDDIPLPIAVVEPAGKPRQINSHTAHGATPRHMRVAAPLPVVLSGEWWITPDSALLPARRWCAGFPTTRERRCASPVSPQPIRRGRAPATKWQRKEEMSGWKLSGGARGINTSFWKVCDTPSRAGLSGPALICSKVI